MASEGTRARGWALAAGLGLLILGGGAFLWRTGMEGSRAGGGPRRDSPPSAAAGDGVRDPAHPSSAPSLPPTVPPPATSDADRVLAFRALARRLEGDVLSQVERELQAGGAPAALRRIRAEVFAAARDDAGRIRQALFARLLAHVAARDPSAAGPALSLAGEILRDPPWTVGPGSRRRRR